MNHHGDLVTVTQSRIFLPSSVLEPLGVSEGSRVYAVLYPIPNGEDHAGCPPVMDLMLTPHPPRLWPYLGRFSLRIKHEPETIHAILQTVADAGFNISTSECTRAGHRYATLSFVADCSGAEGVYDRELSIVRGRHLTEEELERKTDDLRVEVNRRIDDLVVRIRDDHKSLLFFDQANRCHQPVEGCEVEALQYFYREMLRGLEQRPWLRRLSLTWTNGYLEIEEKDLDVLREAQVADQLPCRGIASMDLDEQNVCVALIPPTLGRSFCRMTASYSRSTPRSNPSLSSRSTFATVAARISKGHNLWRVRNQTLKNTPALEDGELRFIMQCTQECREQGTLHPRLKQEIQGLPMPGPVQIDRVVSRQLNRLQIFVSLKHNYRFKDDLLETMYAEGASLGITREEFRIVDTSTQNIADEVIRDMRESEAVLQLFFANGPGSSLDWLNSEALLARYAGKPCARIGDRELKGKVKVGNEVQYHELASDEIRKAYGKQLFRKVLTDLLSQVHGGNAGLAAHPAPPAAPGHGEHLGEMEA